MTETEALNKLDVLLSLLKAQPKATTFQETLDLIYKIDASFDGKLLKMALEKLCNDNYVYALKDVNGVADDIYLISIEGSIFRGYINQRKINDEGVEIILRNENRKSRNDYRLVVGTYLAGIAALLVLLWNILLWYYPKHSDYPLIWIWEAIPKGKK